MTTYSQSATVGLNANSIFTTELYTLPDTAATVGGQQNAMSTGTYVTVKLPDGSNVPMAIDAERSIPGINGQPGKIVLRPLYP